MKRIDEGELDLCFKSIVDCFSKDWLEASAANPIQRLWQRKDTLATEELFSLGHSLKELLQIDAKWTLHQVDLIKNADPNNRKGALFEVLGLGCFDTDLIRVIPAKIGQTGFDGSITFPNGASITLSLKNYGISVHHQSFLEKAHRIEELLKSVLRAQERPSIQLFIDSPKKYPTDADWRQLDEAIPYVTRDFQNEQRLLAVGDSWFVALNDLEMEGRKLHQGFQSYTLLVSSPHHPNEGQNLFSKLDDACYNLSIHAVAESDRLINFVYVHLPAAASLSSCTDWANDYLSNHPRVPISGVFLYQANLTTEVNSNATFISHCYQLRFNEKFTKWLDRNASNSIPIRVPVGRVSTVPTEFKLIMGNQIISVANRYIHQAGNLYVQAEQKAEGTIEGHISKIASGIFTHLVIKPFPNQPEFILSGHFAPEDKLLIL